MAWIMDTYSMHKRHTVTAVVTGKPVEMGGSLGRREATGRGCKIVTLEALKRHGMPVKGARIAVQGFGNVGSVAADLLAREGAVIVAVSDKSGGLYNAKGFHVSELLAWIKEKRVLAGFPDGEAISNEQLLACNCDVLLPAAMENVITSKNAASIQAKIICEGANGPTTAKADAILEQKGIFVIPDILANAGGVTVSYYEWVQNRRSESWPERDVATRLEAAMKQGAHSMYDMARRLECPPRIACYAVALERLITVYEQRGIFP
jgi:glutamate dehydrogenase (NAD(P)+)